MLNKYHLSYQKEFNRKKIHLLSSFIPFFYIICSQHILKFTLILLLIIILIDIFRITKIYEIKVLKNVIRDYEKKTPMTATYLIIVSTLIIFFFNKNIAIYSLLIASVSDSVAALYGIKYGNIKILNNKTLEGTFAFIISGFLLILIVYFIIDAGESFLLFPLLSVVFSAIIEHITVGKYDNITTPLSYALFMTTISKI